MDLNCQFLIGEPIEMQFTENESQARIHQQSITMSDASSTGLNKNLELLQLQ